MTGRAAKSNLLVHVMDAANTMLERFGERLSCRKEQPERRREDKIIGEEPHEGE
jgi:hypothetical protein